MAADARPTLTRSPDFSSRSSRIASPADDCKRGKRHIVARTTFWLARSGMFGLSNRDTLAGLARAHALGAHFFADPAILKANSHSACAIIWQLIPPRITGKLNADAGR